MSVVTTDLVELDLLAPATSQVSQPHHAQAEEPPVTSAAGHTIGSDAPPDSPQDSTSSHNCKDEPSTNHNRVKLRNRCLAIVGSSITSNVLVIPGLLIALLGLVWMLLSQRWTVRNDRLQDCLNFRQVGIYDKVCNSTIQSGLPSFWKKRDVHSFSEEAVETADHAAMIALRAVLTLTVGIMTLLWYRPKMALFRPMLSMVRAKPTKIKGTHVGAGWETGYVGTQSGPIRSISSPDFEDEDESKSEKISNDGQCDHPSEPMPTVQAAGNESDIPETAEELSAEPYHDNPNEAAEANHVRWYIEQRLAAVTAGTGLSSGTSTLPQDISVEALWLLRALAVADAALAECKSTSQQMRDHGDTDREECVRRYTERRAEYERRLNEWLLKYEIDVIQVCRSCPSDVADHLQRAAWKIQKRSVITELVSPTLNENKISQPSRF